MSRSNDYEAIEKRRERVGLAYQDLAQRARVPYTRMYFVLKGELSRAETYRLEQVLEAAERERGR